ncbi:MAG: hypothetical protein QG635_211 [Bacteroidota bacterium]|nr:hypothetical protein [Bacteroidota bacterium]
MLKRKTIYFVSRLLAIVYLTLTFISCSDENPVISPDNYGFDSARFNWTEDTIGNQSMYNYAFWVPDTSNIFLIDAYSNTLLKLDNRNKTFYTFSNNILISVLLGPDLNNGYMFGTDVTEGNTKFLVWKYIGNSFVMIQEIPIPFSTRLWQGYYVSQSEMWFIGRDDGFIAKYDGSSITQYRLPDTLLYMDIFADKQNKIKITALGEEIRNPYPLLINYIFEYDDINNNWNVVFREYYDFSLVVLDRQIFGVKKRAIYSFNGQTFQKILDFSNYLITTGDMEGLSISNFMITCCIPIGNPSSGLAHWNGSKLSNENIRFCTTGARVKMFNDRLCVLVRAANGTTYINIGKKK